MVELLPVEKPQQVALIVVPPVFSVISIIAVGLRVLARRVANRSLELSDWTIIASCILSVAFSGIVMSEGLVGGGGWHVLELTERYGIEVLVRFLKISIGIQILWTLSLSLCKISILILYCRIFSIPFFQKLCYGTAAVIAAWSLSTILLALLICQPMSDMWTPVPQGHCGDQVTSYTVTGSINIVTDLLVLCLPLPYLLRLNMALYKKLVLTATFTVGLFVCIVSALRLKSIRAIDFADITYTVAEAQIWSALEPALGITVACVPVLQPLCGGRHSKTGTALPGTRKLTTNGTRGASGGLDEEASSSQHELHPRASNVEDDAASRGSGVVNGEFGHKNESKNVQGGWVHSTERKVSVDSVRTGQT